MIVLFIIGCVLIMPLVYAAIVSDVEKPSDFPSFKTYWYIQEYPKKDGSVWHCIVWRKSFELFYYHDGSDNKIYSNVQDALKELEKLSAQCEKNIQFSRASKHPMRTRIK